MTRKRQPPLIVPDVPEDLTREEQASLWAYCQKHYPHVSKHRLRSLVNECLAHHAATGNKKGYVRWEAVCRLWVAREERWADARKEARPEVREALWEGDNVVSLVGWGKR